MWACSDGVNDAKALCWSCVDWPNLVLDRQGSVLASITACVCGNYELKEDLRIRSHVRVWACSDRVRAAKALC